ncbi:MAG: hypothetical protein ACRDFB_10260 [Rhabdochlamydiaceae bacterium]
MEIESDNAIVAPTININGTSKEELYSQFRTVADTLQDAMRALAQCSPHGRDYPLDNEFRLAREQYNKRAHMLREIYDEIVNIWQQIDS